MSKIIICKDSQEICGATTNYNLSDTINVVRKTLVEASRTNINDLVNTMLKEDTTNLDILKNSLLFSLIFYPKSGNTFTIKNESLSFDFNYSSIINNEFITELTNTFLINLSMSATVEVGLLDIIYKDKQLSCTTIPVNDKSIDLFKRGLVAVKNASTFVPIEVLEKEELQSTQSMSLTSVIKQVNKMNIDLEDLTYNVRKYSKTKLDFNNIIFKTETTIYS